MDRLQVHSARICSRSSGSRQETVGGSEEEPREDVSSIEIHPRACDTRRNRYGEGRQSTTDCLTNREKPPRHKPEFYHSSLPVRLFLCYTVVGSTRGPGRNARLARKDTHLRPGRQIHCREGQPTDVRHGVAGRASGRKGEQSSVVNVRKARRGGSRC
ncbi:hypothetical protein BD310DRAFT_617264 [Dichomitus squalens]|uniref:Uncharacterized protein n=1 Tax=Dichomitus squalens TaxID=114155 RepID=A0A4Q9PPX5_9APHY|nr:hypothetical protein BD310DRAFT_617264 [Dichomitus squalens]